MKVFTKKVIERMLKIKYWKNVKNSIVLERMWEYGSIENNVEGNRKNVEDMKVLGEYLK